MLPSWVDPCEHIPYPPLPPACACLPCHYHGATSASARFSRTISAPISVCLSMEAGLHGPTPHAAWDYRWTCAWCTCAWISLSLLSSLSLSPQLKPASHCMHACTRPSAQRTGAHDCVPAIPMLLHDAPPACHPSLPRRRDAACAGRGDNALRQLHQRRRGAARRSALTCNTHTCMCTHKCMHLGMHACAVWQHPHCADCFVFHHTHAKHGPGQLLEPG